MCQHSFHVYKLLFFVSWLVALFRAKRRVKWDLLRGRVARVISRVTQKQIRRMFEHSRNLDWPTEFD